MIARSKKKKTELKGLNVKEHRIKERNKEKKRHFGAILCKVIKARSRMPLKSRSKFKKRVKTLKLKSISPSKKVFNKPVLPKKLITLDKSSVSPV
jgi:hypothetical protein